MPEKKSSNEIEFGAESAVTWDHPLVKAGFVPGHLLRQAFGYSVNGWSAWVSQHPQLVKTMNRQAWFNLEVFIAWTASPSNASDLPPTDNQKPVEAKKAQRRHN
jgi:hypothetical protein